MAFNDLNFWIAAFLASVVFGGSSALALQASGREGLGFLLGALLGPVGLIIALIAGASNRADGPKDASRPRAPGPRRGDADHLPPLLQPPPAPPPRPRAAKRRTPGPPQHFIDV